MSKVTLLKFIIIAFVIGACAKEKKNEDGATETLVYINTNFEEHDIFPPWEGQFNSGGFEITAENPRKGDFCVKFTIGENDYWKSPNTGIESARSEIQIKEIASYLSDVYYSWSVLIPSSYSESSDWQVIGQFHDQPDISAGETWANYPANSPPVAFNYKEQKIQLAINSPAGGGTQVISEHKIEKGVWNDIITHVYWTTNNDGFIEVWLNGEPLKDKTSTISRYYFVNLFNKAGNYLKIGLYRSKSIMTENSVFYDEIKSGPTKESVQIVGEN